MRKISISEFKAQCHSIIDEVNKTKQPLCIMRDGRPVAEVVPPSPQGKRCHLLGSGADTFDIIDDDVVGPIIHFKN